MQMHITNVTKNNIITTTRLQATSFQKKKKEKKSNGAKIYSFLLMLTQVYSNSNPSSKTTPKPNSKSPNSISKPYKRK